MQLSQEISRAPESFKLLFTKRVSFGRFQLKDTYALQCKTGLLLKINTVCVSFVATCLCLLKSCTLYSVWIDHYCFNVQSITENHKRF